MESKSGYLKKNLLLFFIATIATRIITFFMIPLYTSYISTTDYGIISYIVTLSDLVFPIVTICIHNGLLRFVFDKNYSHNDVFSTSSSIFLIGSIIYVSVSATIGFFVLDSYYYVIYFILYGLASGLDTHLSFFYRGIGKNNIMMETSIIRALMNCASSIVLIVFLHFQMAGYFWGIYIGCMCSILYGVVRCKIWRFICFRYSKTLGKALIKYSVPLVVSSAGWWVSSFIDRFVVAHFLGISIAGIFFVAYRIPTIVSIFSQIMVNAWTLSAIRDFDPEDKDEFISKTYRTYNFVLILVACSIIILNIPLARILYAKDFFIAWQYTGPLAISVLFAALSNFYDGIFSHVKDTKSTAKAGMIAAIINTVLSLALVKPFGAMGVAWGTLIAHVVVWLVKLLLCQRHIKIKNNYLKDCIVYVMLCILFLNGMNGIQLYFVIESSIFTLSIFILYRKELIMIWRIICNSIRKYAI